MEQLTGTLYIAGPFREKELKQVQRGFEQLLNCKTAFHVEQDDTLIGGFVARIGGKVYDASILSQLNQLKLKFDEDGRGIESHDRGEMQ